jgi:hypothetical protein
LNKLSGITKSMLGSKDDLVFHIREYRDFRYLIDTHLRNDLIETVKKLYADKFKENLYVYAVQEKCLKKFTSCEKLVKRGVSRIPPLHMKVVGEDLI